MPYNQCENQAVRMSAAATALPPPSSSSSSRFLPNPNGVPAVETEHEFSNLLCISYDSHAPVPEYKAPDHSYGESFPGKQRSSTQLTLFSVGVKRG